MSITRQTTEKSTKDRNDAEIAFKEFLKNVKGGKSCNKFTRVILQNQMGFHRNF